MATTMLINTSEKGKYPDIVIRDNETNNSEQMPLKFKCVFFFSFFLEVGGWGVDVSTGNKMQFPLSIL